MKGTAMAYATLTEYDVDLETHINMGKVVGDGPVAGLILHMAGSSPRGVYSLDVWESREHSQRFWVEVMGPGLQTMGIEGGPTQSYQEFEMPYVLRG